VFHVKSAQPVKITDSDLIKRLLLIVLVYGVVMTVRMVAARPRVVTGIANSKTTFK
jgi:G protein-coupled receptor 158